MHAQDINHLNNLAKSIKQGTQYKFQIPGPTHTKCKECIYIYMYIPLFLCLHSTITYSSIVRDPRNTSARCMDPVQNQAEVCVKNFAPQ